MMPSRAYPFIFSCTQFATMPTLPVNLVFHEDTTKNWPYPDRPRRAFGILGRRDGCGGVDFA